jgi:NOL1/NOP2/fmu family ribosome biogenesis protein
VSTRWDSSWPSLVGQDERRRLLSYMDERFGIPVSRFDDYLLFKGRQSWSLLRRNAAVTDAAGLKVVKAGLKAFRKVGAFMKPTTRMVQLFGRDATRARIELDEDRLARLTAGERLKVDLGIDNGYVMLSFGGSRILGLGLYINGQIQSQISTKALRQTMLKIA